MTEPSQSRGRIVMIVDNDVTFDSRVQKQAASAAERGWDVVVVGMWKAPVDERLPQIGNSRLRLVKVPFAMRQRRFEYRRALLRSPFAYPPGKLSNYRLQRSKAWKADLRFRHATLAVGEHRFASVRRAWLSFILFVAKVYGRWVAFRRARTESLAGHRRAMDGPLDRFNTWLWKRILGKRVWRKYDPGIWDWELAFGPVIDRLKPDLIHANDHRMLAIGARAATRAKAAGRDVKLVWDAHEYLPGTKPKTLNPRGHLAQIALEREFSPYADAVVTVSERLADLLVDEHGITERPAIVLNTPTINDNIIDEPELDIRAKSGLPAETPLMVYSGGMAPQRGIDVIIESLPFLQGVHLALVVKNMRDGYLATLMERANELGVTDRIHRVPFVPVDQIVPFLSTADIGVHPLIHLPNHEISLATKVYEYSHARLPILASDVKTMAETIRATGQGEVFRVGDVPDFVRGAKALLADRDRYVRAYDAPGLLEAWTWEPQAEVLDRVYASLLED